MAVKKRTKTRRATTARPTADPVQRMAEEGKATERVDALNAALASINLSQRALAAAAGIDQAHVNRILTGKVARPTFWTLLKLEQAVAHFAALIPRKAR